MLSLKQGLSLNTIKPAPFPASLSASTLAKQEAWYRKNTGFVSTVMPKLAAWNDQSSNNINMLQLNAIEQPSIATNGIVTFDGSDNLQSPSQISLTGDYTIGVVLKPTGTVSNYAVLGDNTTAGQFIKLFDDNTIYIKSGGTVKGISFSTAQKFSNGGYFVLTRDNSNFTLYWNGEQEAQVAAVAGTQLIDTIGGRYIDTEDYVGDITEIMIFSTTSPFLTNEINARFATL
tara:strand:+ start:633 stop:1325 length:693 start_codon:yes stop_codon:yes gene_type:complete